MAGQPDFIDWVTRVKFGIYSGGYIESSGCLFGGRENADLE
ncbi:hypothetical protein WANG_1778 [Lactobacillus kefiranofaciens subsp. kefiranofaciens]|nr:hypothetical protein WANG_1778 [Lactobacillus kefiranofaciens subsp. kefiranofaciens]